MSEATILNAQPVRTLVKEEEMPIVNTSSTSSSPTSSNNLPSNKQESDQSDATDALSSFNKTLLDQEAHDGLLVLAQLNHQDHISDSDEDENESVSKVSALYSLLQDDSDDGEHVSSLPPSATVGTNTPSLVNTHLAKRASRMAAQQQESSTTNSNNSSSNGNKGSTTPKPRKRKTSRRSAMEEDEIADAGAMENDDDEYVADAAEEDDEEMALAGVKKRSSTRRERSPGLGANAASSSNRMDTTEDEVISEEDLIHCVVCKRSNLQVNFKKNYTINTNNYKTYCDTFPQQSDQIPKPRDGESLSVCSTCYNKQWRFARGQYDPSKNRVVNKREGLKNPPKLKDSPRPGEDDGETPNLGLSTPNLLESPPPSEGKKRKVTKRRASTSTTSTPTEDSLNNSAIKEETTSGATTAEETAATIETPKKRAKRAVKAKKAPLPTPPLPSDATATTAATNGIAASAVASSIGASTVPISTLLPGTVMIANGASTTAIPSPSPNKRGRKSKNPPANIGVVSGAPATSYKKEESLSPPPPVISNTALLISYMKRINGILEEIYTTKIVTQNCPDTIEQLRDLVMERLTQKKGELFSFDRACCNSVDRFNNSIKVEVDEFFFKDVKLNNNDSLCIYVNDK